MGEKLVNERVTYMLEDEEVIEGTPIKKINYTRLFGSHTDFFSWFI